MSSYSTLDEAKLARQRSTDNTKLNGDSVSYSRFSGKVNDIFVM
jgi:hypothetical protein